MVEKDLTLRIRMKDRGYFSLKDHVPLLLGVIFLLLAKNGECKKYCTEDSDCNQLGKLKCVKSQCEWGLCGCHRGYVSRYLGSEMRYQCVPLRKIGESCSYKDETGICGAPNSHCKDHRCQCKSGYEAMWGGEYCGDPNDLMPSETVLSSDTCLRGPGASRTAGASYYPYKIMDSIAPSCTCNDGQLELVNTFDLTSAGFLGKKLPVCRKGRIGDKCLTDIDCPNSGKCEIHLHKCVCRKSTHVPNYDKTECASPLPYGEMCGRSGTVCNGDEGLTCGNVCDMSGTSVTCVCGPSHTRQGDKCLPNIVGSPCNGDLNCKALGDNGICEEGVCKNSSSIPVHTGLLLVLSTLVHVFLRLSS